MIALIMTVKIEWSTGFLVVDQCKHLRNLAAAGNLNTPSMSRKGNPYDNAMAENFFSILKTECIYRHKPATFSEANEMIDRYIHFYNHERIQLKTGEAPLVRRLFA